MKQIAYQNVETESGQLIHLASELISSYRVSGITVGGLSPELVFSTPFVCFSSKIDGYRRFWHAKTNDRL